MYKCIFFFPTVHCCITQRPWSLENLNSQWEEILPCIICAKMGTVSVWFMTCHLARSSSEGGCISTTARLSQVPAYCSGHGAPQKAGGYSLKNPVCHMPSLLSPMACPFGSSERVIHLRSSKGKSGKLITQLSVGFGTRLAKKPLCQSSSRDHLEPPGVRGQLVASKWTLIAPL